MHAVAVSVTIKDEDAARKALSEQVVPGVSQVPGAVALAVLEIDPVADALMVPVAL